MQIKILNQLFIGYIRKTYAVQLHSPVIFLKHHRMIRFRRLRLFVNQFKDARGTGDGVLKLCDHARYFIKRLRILIGIA